MCVHNTAISKFELYSFRKAKFQSKQSLTGLYKNIEAHYMCRNLFYRYKLKQGKYSCCKLICWKTQIYLTLLKFSHSLVSKCRTPKKFTLPEIRSRITVKYK